MARRFKSAPKSSTGRQHGNDAGDANNDDREIVVGAEEFVRFIGGEYEGTEAAQGRLRRVLQLAEEKEGVTLEAAFGALDKVRFVLPRASIQRLAMTGVATDGD